MALTFATVSVEDFAATTRKGRTPSEDFVALTNAIKSLVADGTAITLPLDGGLKAGKDYSSKYQFANRARKAADRVSDVNIGRRTLKSGGSVLAIFAVTVASEITAEPNGGDASIS